MAATVLEIPIEKVYISETSTVTVPNATETGGSFVADLNGGAVMVDQFRSLFFDTNITYISTSVHMHTVHVHIYNSLFTCKYLKTFFMDYVFQHKMVINCV